MQRNKMALLRWKLLACALAACVSGAAAQDMAPAPVPSANATDCLTVADVIFASPDHTILAQALAGANLTGVLSNPLLEVTVWAPDDAAFQATLTAIGIATEAALSPAYRSTLVQILQAHVTPAVVEDLSEVDGALSTLDPSGTQLEVDYAKLVLTAGPDSAVPLPVRITDEDGLPACGSMVYPVTDWIIIPPEVVAAFNNR